MLRMQRTLVIKAFLKENSNFTKLDVRPGMILLCNPDLVFCIVCRIYPYKVFIIVHFGGRNTDLIFHPIFLCDLCRKWWMIGLASDFIWSNAQTPLEFLGSFMAISFDDPASLTIKSHELTTEEVVK